MATTHRKHLVAFAYEAWGHTRPLTSLSARMVKLSPIDVTIVTTNTFYERVKNELARNFEAGEEEYAQRGKVISQGGIQFLDPKHSDEQFQRVWKTLASEEEIVCQSSGTRLAPLLKPIAVIMDFMAIGPFNYVRELCGNTVKVHAWDSALASMLFYLFGPESLGGRGNIRVKTEEEAQRSGRSYKEVALEMVFQSKGEVVRVPSMPPMYDYEYIPQEFPLPDEFGYVLFPRVYETLQAMDGMLLVTPECYEPEAVSATRKWFGETGRKVYVCGPLLPAGPKNTAKTHERKHNAESIAIEEFLDATLKTSGPKSLLYISFGTIFWPVTKPENLWAFLDVVMELNIPFILSHASPLSSIPDDVREKVNAYGKGLLATWTPQQLILDHPAMGWFVTHGGHNSVIEAISSGVLLILWPYGGDQPLTAVHCSDRLEIGYELLEPIYRWEDGATKRVRLKGMSKAINSQWEEGGASKRDISAFLDSL